MTEYLYNRLVNVRDPNQLVRWDELNFNNQNTLKRIFDVVFEDPQRHKFGFTFNDVRAITGYHVKDATQIGVKRYEDLVTALHGIFASENSSFPNLVFSDLPNNRAKNAVIPWDYLSPQNAAVLVSLFKAIPLSREEFAHGFTFDQISLISQSTIQRAKSVGQSKSTQLRNSLARIFQESEAIPESARDNLLEAQTIESTVILLERALIELGIQSERNIQISKGRMRVFLSGLQTLDAVGAQYGLTRERARQIQAKVESLRIILPDTPFVLTKGKELIVKSKNIAEFQEAISDSGLSSYPEIDPAWFSEFAKIIGDEQLSEFFAEKVVQLQFGTKEIADFTGSIAKYRSKIGIIDVHKVAVQSGQSYETIRKSVVSRYKRSIVDSNLILAATISRLTMFETVIVKQLMVNPNLTIAELREGIKRQAEYRNSDELVSDDDYDSLIRCVAGEPPSIDFIKSPMKEEIQLSNHEKWLVQLFTSSTKGILHRDSITELALANGISLGSLAIYLSYFPIIRSVGPAVYSLVGTKFTDESLTEIRESARDAAFQTEIAYQVSGSIITLEIKPNIATISSGVVFAPKEVFPFIKNHVFESTCVCGQLKSDQSIKVSKDGFWVGFSALFKHAYRDHRINDDSKLLIKFDLGQKTAQIFGNT